MISNSLNGRWKRKPSIDATHLCNIVLELVKGHSPLFRSRKSLVKIGPLLFNRSEKSYGTEDCTYY